MVEQKFTYYNHDISDLVHDFLADRKTIWGDEEYIQNEIERLENEEGWIWLILKTQKIMGTSIHSVTLGREFLN